MYKLFAVILIVTAGEVTCKKPAITPEKTLTIEDLKGYSYETLVDHGPLTGRATSFFIRKDGSLYLISARHSILGCGSNVSKPRRIIINLDSSRKEGFPLGNSIAHLRCEDDPENKEDVIALEINDKNIFRSVETIREYNGLTDTNIHAIHVFGFPRNGRKLSEKYIPVSHEFFPFVNFHERTDSTTYFINVKNHKWLTDKTALVGYSGSPVYCQMKDSTWRLFGLMSGGYFEPADSVILLRIMKPSTVKKYLR